MNCVAIDRIVTGQQCRQDKGSLEELAQSIQSRGLLKPIGVTAELRLIFGERRLRACRDLLQWNQIPVRIVPLQGMLQGEYAESNVRAEYSPSERVAIARAMEAELPERRGNPAIVQNPVRLKGKTVDFVARKAGFKNRESYRQARKVVDHGDAKLIDAMDRGQVAISTAATLLKLPVDQRERLLGFSAREIRRQAQALLHEQQLLMHPALRFGSRSPTMELLDELQNHADQLQLILGPYCQDEDNPLYTVERRQLIRLMREIGEMIDEMRKMVEATRLPGSARHAPRLRISDASIYRGP